MPTSKITVSIDSPIKADLDRIFSSIGLTTPEAILIFLRQAYRHRGLPLRTDEHWEAPWQLTILDLSAEGYKNMAHALDDIEPFQTALNKHQKDFQKFNEGHNIEVRE